MVRKVSAIFVCVLLCCGFAATAHAQSYTAYDGNMNSTYITYFRDIVGKSKISENYVAFRSGQNEYCVAVGKLTYQNGVFSSAGTVKVYKIGTSGGANNSFNYTVTSDSSFRLSVGNELVYSDLGDFPEMIDRGTKYEIITAILLCVALLGYVIRRIFG